MLDIYKSKASNFGSIPFEKKNERKYPQEFYQESKRLEYDSDLLNIGF